ncbi:MAG: class II aldolase/adducin family protein [Anaerolineales bacterium]|nr:class II aldolase/adducin family protein [Anaerolineales bacterium]
MDLLDTAKQQVMMVAQDLTRKGYLLATGGNLSLRIANTELFAITPSNFDYMKMTSADVCVLDFALKQHEGGRKPSVESAMHAAIYQARADVRAVVHTHQVYASALALMRTSIPALFDEQARFLGRSVKLIPYAPSGTSILKKVIARNIGDHNNAYLMQNHGALCFGHDLERAAHNVEILEKCALAYLLTLMTGRKAGHIPLAVREIAFAKLRRDQKKAREGLVESDRE